jgi:hypothetical protein
MWPRIGGECCGWQKKSLTIRHARLFLHLFNIIFFLPGRASPTAAHPPCLVCRTLDLLAQLPSGAVLFGVGVSLVRAEASAGLDSSLALPWMVSVDRYKAHTCLKEQGVMRLFCCVL